MATVIEGVGTVPSGADEEVVARPTILERFVRWCMKIDEETPEERELLLQLARREKLKLDLFEERQARRKAREEKTKLVATWYYEYYYDHKDAILAFELRENDKIRKVVPLVAHYAGENGKVINSPNNFAEVKKLAMGTSVWSQLVRPWIENNISNDNLQKLCKKNKVKILFPLT